ncbi:CCR4-associated factor 1-like 7 [Spatholobus suberectus]|nr:CCR4-associated factor 1-like 7 [Spatholobus suberectus]
MGKDMRTRWICANKMSRWICDYGIGKSSNVASGNSTSASSNANEDVLADDSIELLCQSAIDFKKNNEKSINERRSGEILMLSGIVLNDSVHGVTFHSGYDFRCLLKRLTCQNLPDTQVGFFNLINMYFPTVYDIKHLMKFCNSLHGELTKLAELLEVESVGICHQAGSNTLLTTCMFRKLKNNFFSGSLKKYASVL